MKKIIKILQAVAPWLLIVAAVFLRSVDPKFLELVRYKSFDAYQQAWPKEAVDLPIYVIDVDDKSLAEYGQWPWPRTQIATLVQKLFNTYGVAGAAFDMVFAEPDRTSPENIIKSNPDGVLVKFLEKMPKHDDVLANEIKNHLVVLGRVFSHNQENINLPNQVRFLEKQSKSDNFNADINKNFYNFSGVIRNLEVLENNANAIGQFNIVSNVDSIVRQVPAVVSYKDHLYPTLSLELLRILQGERQPIFMNYDAGGYLNTIRVGQFEVPVDERGAIWPRFRAFDAAKYISASDILSGRLPLDVLEGGYVFVGTSAPGLFDLRSTPLDPIVPGVELHVQLMESIITGEALYRPMFADVVEQLFTAVASVVLVLLMLFAGARLSFVAMVAIVSGVVFFSIWMFLNQGVLIDATYPAVTVILVYSVLVAQKYMKEEKQRRSIRNAFAHYLSPDLVSMLGQEDAELTLGGEQKEMSIMFTDIRGFTSLSEGLSPDQLTSMLNRYLTPMTEIVQKNQGTIDKYIGDAVMAFWNAPLNIEQHPQKACKAAVDMLNELRVINKAFKVDGLPALSIGIGIHVDTVSVGNMGSEQRFDYTVIGDGVNLASRLEGLCKPYGVEIIVSEAVVRQSEGFLFSPLDKVAVKGKEEPVAIYALVDDDQSAKIIQKGFVAYQSADWDGALFEYSKLTKYETLRNLYLDRIRELQNKKITTDWDGIYRWQTK